MGLMMDEPNAKEAQSKVDIKLLIEMVLQQLKLQEKFILLTQEISKILEN